MSLHKSTSLMIVIGLTIFTAFFTYTSLGSPIFRTILVLPFVLFLPGYALLSAVSRRTPADGPEFVLLSVGLSIAIAVLCGVVLSWTTFGLQARSWSIALAAITVIASLVGLSRRREVLPNASSHSLSTGMDLVQQMMLGLAVVVAVAAFLIARQGLVQQPTEPFTQLWLLPPQKDAPTTVQFGINNQEQQTVTYRLQLINDPILIEQWSNIELEPGQKWESKIELPADLDPTIPVKARLYRQDAPGEVYRETLIWLEQSP